MNPNQEQTPSKVLSDFIEYAGNGEPSRDVIDDIYGRLLKADPEVLKKAVTGARKKTVKNLIDADTRELTAEDYERKSLTSAQKVVVEKIIELINSIDAANKVSGASTLDNAQMALTDYVAGHQAEIDVIMIDEMPFGKYLHAIAGTEECNNILATRVRPRLQAISAGTPLAVLVEQRLKAAGVL
jgi:hypothetical protein